MVPRGSAVEVVGHLAVVELDRSSSEPSAEIARLFKQNERMTQPRGIKPVKIRGSAVALAVVVGTGALGACGGGGSTPASTSTSRATPTTTALKTSGFTSVEQLRTSIINGAHLSCGDAVWKPNLAPTIQGATGEGVCADTLTLVTFPDSEVNRSAISYGFAGKAVEDALKNSMKNDSTWLVGPGWGAYGVKVTLDQIKSSIGGVYRNGLP